MRNEAFEHSLKSLAHPLSLAAVVVVLINDHVLRQIAPSWLTGKLSDFAWLIFAPFLLAAIFAWFIPARVDRRTELVGGASILLTGLIFGLAKTIPFFHSAAVQFLQAINGWSTSLRIDPTDLLMLPALLISIWIWQASARPLTPVRVWPLLLLAILSTTATSPAYYETGVRQIVDQSGVLYTQDFFSIDGGYTWLAGGKSDVDPYGSYDYPWHLSDPANDRIVYSFNPGISIDRSEDGGLSWRRDFDLSGEQARIAAIASWNTAVGPFGAVIHRSTGNLVVAMGLEGVLIRSANGAWNWVQVGSFSVPQMNKLDRIISLLSGELWLGLALIALLIGSFTMHFELWRMGKIILGSAFMLILIAAWVYWLVLPSYYGDDLVLNFVTLALTLATIFFGRRRFGLLKLVLVIAWLALAIWSASAAFGRPYYGTSFKAVFGIVLVVITLAIGWRLRSSSSSSSALSMIALIVFSALAEAWALWIWQISQQWPYYSGVSLYVELTVFFTVATIGLTLLTLLRRQALGRAWLFSLWGGWLLLGFALVTQFGYLKTDVIEAIVLVALTIGSIGLARRKNIFGDVTQMIVIVGWLEWLAALMVIKPALPNSGFLNLAITLPMIVIPIIFVGLWCVAKFHLTVRANVFKLWFIIAAGALLYGLPFVLWTQGAIPFYDSALLYAIAFALAVLIAGKQYLKRQTIDVQPAAGEGQAKI